MNRHPALDPVVAAVLTVAGYNVIQNTILPERWYPPANLAMAAGLVAHARRAGVSSSDLGLVGGDVRTAARTGGGVIVLIAVGTTLVARTPHLRRLLLDERARGHDRRTALHRVLIRFPLGTALFEEVAFRGVLRALWRRRMGEAEATVASAVAFGAWHVLPTFRLHSGMAGGRSSAGWTERAAAVVIGAVITTAGGVLFDRLRSRSGTLLAPWLAHTGFSVVSYLAARRAWARVE